MSAKGLTMTVAGVAVAAGTYFGLETVFPRDEATDQGTPDLASVDEVFSGTLQEPGAMPAGPAEAPAEERAMNAGAPAQEAAAAQSLPAGKTQAAPALPEPVEPEPPPKAEARPAPEPVAKPAPAPARAVTPSKPANAAPSRKAERLTQWWGPESATELSIVYAGSAAYARAIVLMFNGAFDDAGSAAKNIRVTDANGKAVSGSWQVGAKNKRMLQFPVSKTGIYIVSVGPGLVDRTGRKLGKSLTGPVRVQ